MSSMLAATTHSPLLAMIMAFEISGNYSLVPALMLACAVCSLLLMIFIRMVDRKKGPLDMPQRR